MQLKLRARLVVLSACENGSRGDYRRGRDHGVSLGILLLPVVQRWLFHRQLRSGLSTASALRVAELKLRQNEEYAHPFYWASFVVAGAGE